MCIFFKNCIKILCSGYRYYTFIQLYTIHNTIRTYVQQHSDVISLRRNCVCRCMVYEICIWVLYMTIYRHMDFWATLFSSIFICSRCMPFIWVNRWKMCIYLFFPDKKHARLCSSGIFSPLIPIHIMDEYTYAKVPIFIHITMYNCLHIDM